MAIETRPQSPFRFHLVYIYQLLGSLKMGIQAEMWKESTRWYFPQLSVSFSLLWNTFHTYSGWNCMPPFFAWLFKLLFIYIPSNGPRWLSAVWKWEWRSLFRKMKPGAEMCVSRSWSRPENNMSDGKRKEFTWIIPVSLLTSDKSQTVLGLWAENQRFHIC